MNGRTPNDTSGKPPAKDRSAHQYVPMALWVDPRVTQLDLVAKAVLLYLRTGPHARHVPGLYHAPKPALARGLRIPEATLEKAWGQIVRAGLAEADWTADVVYVPGVIEDTPLPNGNQVKGWRNTYGLSLIPDCELKERAIAVLVRHVLQHGSPDARAACQGFFPDYCAGQVQGAEGARVPEGFPNGSERGPEGLTNHSEYSSSGSDSTSSSSDSGSGSTSPPPQPLPDLEEEVIDQQRQQPDRPKPAIIPPGGEDPDFVRFWKVYPKKERRAATWAVWQRAKGGESFPGIERLVKAISHKLGTKKWKDGYAPEPSTYLDSEGWNDVIEQVDAELAKGVKTSTAAPPPNEAEVLKGAALTGMVQRFGEALRGGGNRAKEP